MIDDLDKSIERLLTQKLPNKNVEITFDQPNREWSQKLTKPTINFFLYDVRENPTLRQHQWQDVSNKYQKEHPNELKKHWHKRTAFRLDCFYMLTVWGTKVKDQHKLLTECLKVLLRFPILEDIEEDPQKKFLFLEPSLKQSGYEIQARIANHDRLTNPAEIWSALDNDMRPSIPYIITLAIDPWEEESEPIAQTLILHSGQADSLPDKQQMMPDKKHQDAVLIGGTIRRKSDQKPLDKIEVDIKETGLVATTDKQGRFTFARVVRGTHILRARPDTGEPIEKKITVPGVPGEYDLEL